MTNNGEGLALNPQELRIARAKLIHDARQVIETAKKEGRAELNASEREVWDKHIKESDKLADTIAVLERQEAVERHIAEPVGRQAPAPGSQPPEYRNDHERRAAYLATPEYRAAYRRYLSRGEQSPELRALQADSDTLGGYLLAPQEMSTQLIKFVNDLVWIRKFATIDTVHGSQSMGVASLDADPADSDWTTELATGGEDSTMAFGKRELTPHPLAKLIKISNKLLQRNIINPETVVMERLAYKFAISEEKAFMTGTGASQPLGLFTASSAGISTGRDYSTGNTTTAPTFDGLIGAKYTLKQQYQNSPSVGWLLNRTTISTIAQIKDGQSRYQWQPSVVVGSPDMLLGKPVYSSEYVPNTMTTGLYFGMIGDFSKYRICDVVGLGIQRLLELYAATNQTGYFARIELDGMPVLEEAFVRLKLA